MKGTAGSKKGQRNANSFFSPRLRDFSSRRAGRENEAKPEERQLVRDRKRVRQTEFRVATMELDPPRVWTSRPGANNNATEEKTFASANPSAGVFG